MEYGMKRLQYSVLLIVGILLVVTAFPVRAQTYYFSVDEEYVQVYWESDGSIRIEYIMVYQRLICLTDRFHRHRHAQLRVRPVEYLRLD